MATEISLNCCILGLDNLKTFPIDIVSSKTVGHLKNAIKKRNPWTLQHIEVDQLEIWKVNDLCTAYPP